MTKPPLLNAQAAASQIIDHVNDFTERLKKTLVGGVPVVKPCPQSPKGSDAITPEDLEAALTPETVQSLLNWLASAPQ